jgi:hypothetical protein
VAEDQSYQNGTTVEEAQKYHRDTLKLALGEANALIAGCLRRKQLEAERERVQREQHAESVRDAARDIEF